jgi:hypothetical protein
MYDRVFATPSLASNKPQDFMGFQPVWRVPGYSMQILASAEYATLSVAIMGVG